MAMYTVKFERRGSNRLFSTERRVTRGLRRAYCYLLNKRELWQTEVTLGQALPNHLPPWLWMGKRLP